MKYKSTKKNINFEKSCRLCLSENISTQTKSKDLFSTKISFKIEFCSSIKILKNDGLPNRICLSCSQNISKFYAFKKRIERNDKILKVQFDNETIKKDILDIALNEADIIKEHCCNDLNIISEDVNENSGNINIENNYSKSPLPFAMEYDEKPKEENLNFSDRHEVYKESDEGSNNFLCPNVNDNSFSSLTQVQDKIETSQLLSLEPPPLIPLTPIKDDLIIPNLSEINTKASFECTKCEEKFTDLELLKKHKENCLSLSSLMCNICKKEFKEHKKLISHLKAHMITKDYVCKICRKSYPNPSTFEIHLRTHTGERPFKCSVCTKGFTRWAGVISHMKTHDDHRPFKCDDCDKSFKISSNLERHKILHSGNLPHCCSYCGKTFSQADNLLLHVRSYHTNERPYLCSRCGKGFVSSARLNRHMWVHTGYKPFRCNTCPKVYSNSSDLKNHKFSTHSNGNSEKPFSCNSCSMSFFQKCRLKKHLKTHQRPFACNYCNKTFNTSTILDKHVSSKHSENIQVFLVFDKEEKNNSTEG